jgi:hypothetical protein
VAGNTGTYLNIQKSAYPGKFSVPNFNAPGSLTPALVRAIQALIEISLGVEKAEQSKMTPHCNVDMAAAWENLSLTVQRVDITNLRGDESEDMLKRKRSRTIGGRKSSSTNARVRATSIGWRWNTGSRFRASR